MALGHFESENRIAGYFAGLGDFRFLKQQLIYRDYSPMQDRCPRGYFLPRNHRFCRSCPSGTLWSPEGCTAMRFGT